MVFRRALFVALVASACSDNNAGPDATQLAPLPDLRLKFVGAFPSYPAGTELGGGAIPGGGGTTVTTTQALWSPAAIAAGSGSVTSFAYGFAPTQPLEPVVSINGVSPTDAVTIASTSYVLYSLGYGGAFVTYTGAAPGSDFLSSYSVQSSQVTTVMGLMDYAEQAAGQGFVITALGFDGSAAQIAAYSVPDDTRMYSVVVMTGDPETLASEAPVIVATGSYITAFGQLDATNYALVATSISGTPATRSAMVAGDSLAPSPNAGDLLQQGWAIVGGYFDGSNHAQFILEQ